MSEKLLNVELIKERLIALNVHMIDSGIDHNDLRRCYEYIPKCVQVTHEKYSRCTIFAAIFLSFLICLLACTHTFDIILSYFLGIRCFLPNNYLVWEATRPISDCSFCEGVSKPIILFNATKEDFKKYAYSSKPIIVKGGVKHWKAMHSLDFDIFKDLYEHTSGAYESVEESCQFLHFKSDLFSLRQVFAMSQERARNDQGQEPWYVGWGNCHPQVLATLRQYYSFPEFLPDDSEFPNSENVFFGYGQGAVMHLDYIPRLMWQGQVKGNKTWNLAPTPECDGLCKPFQFYVEPGDAVFLDTRIWYHATKIPSGQFSLTVQSEYG